MTRLLRDGVSAEEAADIYEAWLLGERPAKGAAVSSGPVLCLTGSVPAAGNAEPFGEAADVRTALDEARTKGALRNFRDWRRMPAGAAACSSSARGGGGLFFFGGTAPFSCRSVACAGRRGGAPFPGHS